MNSEILILQAGEALEEYSNHHNTTCVLFIRDGFICCEPLENHKVWTPASLKITPFAQRYGLTHSQWLALGTSLLNLYNKELSCRTRQKP